MGKDNVINGLWILEAGGSVEDEKVEISLERYQRLHQIALRAHQLVAEVTEQRELVRPLRQRHTLIHKVWSLKEAVEEVYFVDDNGVLSRKF